MVIKLNRTKNKGKKKAECRNHSHLTSVSAPDVWSFFLPFLFGVNYGSK